MTIIDFVFLQRGWGKPFRPYDELFWLAVILIIFIIWLLFNYYLDYSETRAINKKIDASKEIYNRAKVYLSLQGWTITEKNELNGLEYPQVFIKKYKTGYLFVFKVKTKEDLSVSYFINETPVKGHRIKLHSETILNMKKVLKAFPIIA